MVLQYMCMYLLTLHFIFILCLHFVFIKTPIEYYRFWNYTPYLFLIISYRFCFWEKYVKTEVIWPPIDRRSFPSLSGRCFRSFEFNMCILAYQKGLMSLPLKMVILALLALQFKVQNIMCGIIFFHMLYDFILLLKGIMYLFLARSMYLFEKLPWAFH